MGLIRTKEDPFALVEKRYKYRFWDKERERSNHAVQMQQAGVTRPRCSHQKFAWSGPPHDLIQTITCLDCQSYATEPEMKDRGFDFNDCPDWIFFAIMDERASKRNQTQFVVNRSSP